MRAPALPQCASSFLRGTLLKASQLRSLYIYTLELCNATASRFAASFGHITGLEALSINGWDVMASEGAKAVSDAIEDLRKLTRLDLSGGFSGDMG